MDQRLSNHGILSEPSLPACGSWTSPCVESDVTSISRWLSRSSKVRWDSRTNHAWFLKSQSYAGRALMESNRKTKWNSMGTVERGVPPNCPDQNGDIPASVHTQSWSALSELLPSLAACHFKILTSWRVTALICLGTRRYAFLQTLLCTLLRIMQRSQALPHFRFSFRLSQMKLGVRTNVQKLKQSLKMFLSV